MFNQLNCFDWLQNKKPTNSNSFNCVNPILSETHCIQNSNHIFSFDNAFLASSNLALLQFSFGNMFCKRNSYTANFKLFQKNNLFNRLLKNFRYQLYIIIASIVHAFEFTILTFRIGSLCVLFQLFCIIQTKNTCFELLICC